MKGEGGPASIVKQSKEWITKSWRRAIRQEDVQLCMTTDQHYGNAWWMHYCGFQPNNRLLPEGVGDKIYAFIEKYFASHYIVICSLIIPNGAHEPAHRTTKGYKMKQCSLANQFCALIRTWNPAYLMHWAMVGMMVMYHKGLNIKCYHNPLLKAFCSIAWITVSPNKRVGGMSSIDGRM